MSLSILRRERLLVLGGLVLLCGLAWLYLLDEAAGMSGMSDAVGMSGMAASWTLRELGYLFVMWSIMMVAMMLPSAAPMILLFATITRSRRERRRPEEESSARWLGPMGAFVLGYILVWTAFSLAAATAQWALHAALLLSPAMISVSEILSGSILVAAGLYQFSGLKNACVAHCRSPISFIGTHWREGTGGALRMGAHHGVYCVGCCWALMALLFVLGVMNLLWVLALAVIVLAEKTLSARSRITRWIGVGLIVWGGLTLLA